MTFIKTITLLIHLFFGLYNSCYKSDGWKSGLPNDYEGSKSGLSDDKECIIEFVEDINPLDRTILEKPFYIQVRPVTNNER